MSAARRLFAPIWYCISVGTCHQGAEGLELEKAGNGGDPKLRRNGPLYGAMLVTVRKLVKD